ncbi:MAG: M50 family metallopeptidase [Fimbriimonas sp.]|nr:M50 family metallopeptidase [Fimbriimonas sp.]
MSLIFYYLLTAFVLLTMFTVLVAAHEFGHYLFARIFNMGVEEFAIGFGKPQLWTYMRRKYRIPVLAGEISDIRHDEVSRTDVEASVRPPEDIVELETPEGKVLEETTRFTVRMWPLGGFVRIKGMVPEEDGSETKIAGGFYSKPPWQRLIVLFAGPAFSVIAGLAILIPNFMIEGNPKLSNVPKIGQVMPHGPADKAGLKEGDFVKSIDGKPIATFYAMNRLVRDSANRTLTFVIDRGGKQLTVSVVPELDDSESPVLDENLNPTGEMRRQAKLKTGIPSTREAIGFVKATEVAVKYPVEAVTGLLGVVRHPSTFKDNVGGPIMITRVAYDTVRFGLPAILELAALLSISVGVFNLLPVLPLDGGQMAMAIAEMFRGGRRLSIQVQSTFNVIGLMCMVALIVTVAFVDFGRIASHNSPLKEAPAKKAAK